MKRFNSLLHSACFSWLIVLNRRRWQTICWRAPQAAQSTEFKSGLFVGHMWGSMNVTFSRRRYVGVFLAVCDGALSCCWHPCKMPALLLQHVTVTLDNNWDNKHVVPCCYFINMCNVLLQKSSCFVLLLLRHLTFHTWGVVGSLVIVLLQSSPDSDSEIILKIG